MAQGKLADYGSRGLRILSPDHETYTRVMSTLRKDKRVSIYSHGKNIKSDSSSYPYYTYITGKSTGNDLDFDDREYLANVLSSAEVADDIIAVQTALLVNTPLLRREVHEPSLTPSPLFSDELVVANLRNIIDDVLQKRFVTMKNTIYEAFSESVVPALTAVKEGQNEVLGKLAQDIKLKGLEAKNASWEQLSSELDHDNNRMKRQIDHLLAKQVELVNQVAELQSKIRARTDKTAYGMLVQDLPKTLNDMLDFFASLFEDRIHVLQEARESADKWELNNIKDLEDAWKVLRSVAGDLWVIVFEEKAKDIEGCFKERTTLELALTEKRSTKNDSELMRLRERTYLDQNVDITPHVKMVFRNKRDFRMYFYLDHTNRLVVIGHCGNHLDTSGTRRMS